MFSGYTLFDFCIMSPAAAGGTAGPSVPIIPITMNCQMSGAMEADGEDESGMEGQPPEPPAPSRRKKRRRPEVDRSDG